MAKFGGAELHKPEKKFFTGAAFQLSKPSQLTKTIILPNKDEVKIVNGNPCAVVRMRKVPKDSILSKSYSNLQSALDWLSASGKADLSLTKTDEENVYWWQEGKTNHVCLKSRLTDAVAVPNFKVSIGGKEKTDESKLLASSDHPGFRYYRLAQITEDLHDAYRNMFLAFELTLSRNFPKGKEREGEWIKRAIQEAEPELSLSKILKVPAHGTSSYVFNKFYKDIRLPLFHAKYDRKYHTPQSILKDREIIADALNELTRVVLRMFEVWHNTRRKGGAVYPHFLFTGFCKSIKDTKMVFSNHNEFNPDENNLDHPRFKNGVTSSQIKIYDDKKGRPSFQGKINIARNEIPIIARVDIINNEFPIFAIQLSSELCTKNIHVIHVHVDYRVLNLNQPKERFEL